jgi:hypothetical protein
MVDLQRRHRQVKKPVHISDYNMFMNEVDRADQYLSCYSLLRKTVKWAKKVVLWLVNYAFYNSFCMHKILNLAKQLKYKIFLLQVAKAWAEDKMEAAESQSDSVRLNATGTINYYPTQVSCGPP